MSKEAIRTITFAAVAAVSVAFAAGVSLYTRPKAAAGLDKLGQEFYPDFVDPTTAKALKLVSYNAESATVTEFDVELKDGLWQLPTYNNYPADAEDRLAETAKSIIGIARGPLVGQREAEQEEFGVIDPLDETKTTLKGRGQRLTLTKEDGSVLADYIIGKPVEGFEGQYYVRRADENEIYRATLKINLSTKFTDWIESDLLKLDRDALKEIVIHKYSLDESRGEILGAEVIKLTRDKSFDPWKLDGLDETTEQVNEPDLRTMVSTLDDLKIVGVRKKPEGLNPDLTLNPEFIQNQLQVELLRRDLEDRGYFVAKKREGDGVMLVSSEGEMTAATDGGVVYSLHFGKVFTGSPFEVETGFATEPSKKDDAADKPADDQPFDPNAPGEKPAAEEEKDSDAGSKKLEQSRYLFIAANFDPSYLGPAPVEPVKPEPPAAAAPAGESPTPETPAEDKPADSATSPSTDAPPEGASEPNADNPSDSEDSDGTEDEADEPAPADPPADPPAETSPPPTAPAETSATPPTTAPTPGEQPAAPTETEATPAATPDPKQAYDEALKKYEQDLTKFKTDKAAYDEKLANGQKAVDALNLRFGKWYYVISEDSFKKLRLSRASLVQPKESKPAGAAAPGGLPGGLPGGAPPFNIPNQ